MAVANYHHKYGCFPPAFMADANGRPMHSWRVLLLPFLEERESYAAYNFAAALASLPAGRLHDRRGSIVVLSLGVASFLVAYAGFALTGGTLVLLIGLFLLAGAGKGLVETAEQAAVAALAPIDLRGSAFGVLAAIQSFGNLAASAIAGLLWTLVSPRVAFFYLTGWMLLSLFALSRARRS